MKQDFNNGSNMWTVGLYIHSPCIQAQGTCLHHEIQHLTSFLLKFSNPDHMFTH